MQEDNRMSTVNTEHVIKKKISYMKWHGTSTTAVNGDDEDAM